MIYITVKDAEVLYLYCMSETHNYVYCFMKPILAKKEQNSTPVAIAAHHFLHCPPPSTHGIMGYLHVVQIFLNFTNSMKIYA